MRSVTYLHHHNFKHWYTNKIIFTQKKNLTEKTDFKTDTKFYLFYLFQFIHFVNE